MLAEARRTEEQEWVVAPPNWTAAIPDLPSMPPELLGSRSDDIIEHIPPLFPYQVF